MAAPNLAESGPPKKIFEISIVRAKPKYLIQYLQSIPQAIAVHTKHGAKLHGHWLVEAGAAQGPEVVFFAEHESLDARSTRTEKLMQDPEFQKLMMTTGKYVYNVENYLCFQIPCMPSSPCPPGTRVILEQLKCNGFPVYSVTKMMEMFQMWDKYVEPNGPKPIGVFRPIAYSKPCIFGLFPAAADNKLDGVYETYFKMISDAKNWPKLNEVYEKVEESTARILVPIKLDLLPKEDGCKPM